MVTDAVRIDDFANPTFAPDVSDFRSALAPVADGLVLEPRAVMREAAAQTGLDDFGDPSFEERLALLLECLREDIDLSPFGVVSSHSLLVQLLRNRLLLQDLLVRHPEIHEVEVTRPIFIAGLPRSGTTHLHNLLAADPGLRSLPYWESLEPVLADAERPAGGAPDPRLARTETALDVVNASMPYFKRMHEMTVEHAHEEIQLLSMDFSSQLFETTVASERWRDYYRSHDQTPHYEYLRTALKALTFLRGGDRWVLKSPQHLEQFRALTTVFPDATFVVTHREPVAVTASVVTMLAYTARMHTDRPDPQFIATYWSERVEQMLQACVRDRPLLPDDQTIDVRFDEFMADDMAMVARVYDVAGQPMTAEGRAAMAAFLATHQRGRHGTVVYDLRDFGIDPDERRKALAFYAERFGV